MVLELQHKDKVQTVIETEIIRAVKKQEKGAFKMMYQGCIGYVYSIVRRYVSNQSDHKDVIQEIFARIFLSIKTFDAEKGDFKTWLRRVVINQCMQHYRQGKSPAIVVPLSHFNGSETGFQDKLAKLTKEEIEYFLSNMPEGYRRVFMLVVIDEYTHKEVGALLGISAETSRSQLSRAKNWLRDHISSHKINRLVNGI